MAEVGAVLVHGLFNGAWAWDGVRARLEAAGVPSAAVELPMTSLEDDVAATVAELDRFGKPAVLVGHSYGGAVVTAAGEHPQVRHLLYLAAFALAEGESVSRALPDRDIPPTGLGEALRFSAEGQQVSVDPALAVDLFYADAPADRRGGRGRPASARPPVGVPRGARHHRLATRPSTYVVCADDRTVHPDLQRAMAERATDRQEWPGGHSPILTRPAAGGRPHHRPRRGDRVERRTTAVATGMTCHSRRSPCPPIGGHGGQPPRQPPARRRGGPGAAHGGVMFAVQMFVAAVVVIVVVGMAAGLAIVLSLH